MKDDLTPESTRPETSVTRRRAIASLGTVGLIALSGQTAFARQTDATPAASAVAGETEEVTMPDWRFGVISSTDPYTGDISRPDVIPAGVRVVAFEVSLSNQSDQYMDFSVRNVRVRDANGVEYPAGEYLGTEPRMVSQNLPNGERARGWVWFGVPEDAELASIVFLPPIPLLRIVLG